MGKCVCEFLGADPFNYEMCDCCPFGFGYGEPTECPTATSVEHAINILDEVAERAKTMANELTNM